MTNGDSGDKKAAGVKAWLCGVCCSAVKFARDHSVTVAVVIAIAVEGVLVYLFWPIKGMGDAHLRNFVLASAAVLGFPFLVWRAVAFGRQVEATQKQAETDSRRRLTEVYAKSAEMFASELLSVRLAGLFGLWDLARDNPEIYHIRIMDLICAFIRKPLTLKDWVGNQSDALASRPDVSAAIALIRERVKAQIKVERQRKYRLKFVFADLQCADFMGADLNYAYFNNANLKFALFGYADLREAMFFDSELLSADFPNADLRGAIIKPRQQPHILSLGMSMVDAAINGTHFGNQQEIEYDLSGAVILTNKQGDALPPQNSELIRKHPDIRVMCIGDWQAAREEWREQYLPSTTTTAAKK